MRELIYVSEAKLRQLVPALPGGAGRLRDVDAEVKTPLGGVKIGKAAKPSEPSLAAAVAALESSSRAPKWFADPAVQPGQWVHFEARLSYGMTRDRGMVFFVDHEATSVRLLLHGSAAHLLGSAGASRDVDWPRSSWKTESLHRFLDELAEERRPLDDGVAFDTGQRVSSKGGPANLSIREAVNLLSYLLETEHTAAWMAGYARITAIFPGRQGKGGPDATVVAATPLYVEYVDPPGDALATT